MMELPEPQPKFEQHVRIKWRPNLEAALPYGIRVLLEAYQLAKGPQFYVEIPDEPPSANRLHHRRVGQKQFFLDPQVKAFRALTDAATWSKRYNPRGVVGCIIIVESPVWVTKKHTVRRRDADNPVKALFDALQLSVGMPDELIWQFTSAKMLSRRSATHVWLFGLGDVITGIGGISNADHRTATRSSS